ncbi:Plasmodium vivax Vir protein, putative [Plasmodium vivax]|uniref:Vir protein, putative n=1 Tax=Plasmodium vivax TaxID=5855 RepID=A0A1G4EC70_PLAVI|nr:Plasmodium vivax Vir protein, putative [Plasmodium vivax]
MTKCTSKSKDYIDYNCYLCLKDKFHGSNVADNAKPYLDQALNSTFRNINNSSDIKELLEWILKHLTCIRAFWETDINPPCKYINFWLNEKIQRLYSYVSNSDFGKFEEFVKKFYTAVNYYRGYESCTKNIQLLKDDEYKKLNTLYTLYKTYDDLKLVHEYMIDLKQQCGSIDYIIKQANDVANLDEDDVELINVLRDFRNIIKNPPIDYRYKALCAFNLKQIDTMVSLKLFPDKVPDPPTPQVMPQSHDTLGQPTHQALTQHVTENGIGNQSEANVNLQASSSTVQLTQKDHLTQVPHVVSPHEESHHLEESIATQHSRGSHHASSRHTENIHEDGFNSGPFSRDRNEQSRDAHSSLEYTGYNSFGEGITKGGVITPTDGTQGYLETFKGTITGVLGYVDPGPVLGVSGGMGALFLLFKYTPVGSFFGGRRGRFRQIPRSFNGPFPGEFPNFHEYGGGYVGYSPMDINPLAE